LVSDVWGSGREETLSRRLDLFSAMVGFVGGLGCGVSAGSRARAVSARRVQVVRSAAAGDKDEEEKERREREKKERMKRWQEEMRVLLDRDTSMDTRGVLFFDLLKQSPEIAEELYKEASEKAGVDGIGPVVNQVVRDIIPEIQKNGPMMASKVGALRAEH